MTFVTKLLSTLAVVALVSTTGCTAFKTQTCTQTGVGCDLPSGGCTTGCTSGCADSCTVASTGDGSRHYEETSGIRLSCGRDKKDGLIPGAWKVLFGECDDDDDCDCEDDDDCDCSDNCCYASCETSCDSHCCDSHGVHHDYCSGYYNMPPAMRVGVTPPQQVPAVSSWNHAPQPAVSYGHQSAVPYQHQAAATFQHQPAATFPAQPPATHAPSHGFGAQPHMDQHQFGTPQPYSEMPMQYTPQNGGIEYLPQGQAVPDPAGSDPAATAPGSEYDPRPVPVTPEAETQVPPNADGQTVEPRQDNGTVDENEARYNGHQFRPVPVMSVPARVASPAAGIRPF